MSRFIAVVVMAWRWRRFSASGRPGRQRRRRARGYDLVLDTNVRDGLVYYRALGRTAASSTLRRLARARPVESAPRNEQIAFWLNAYNALVLQTVIDHYPIPCAHANIRRAASVRFRAPSSGCRIGSPARTLTLDQIEQTVLPGFKDPRLFLALGRGAVGSGRLRSEAYTGAELERQLTEIANECVNRAQCIQIDRGDEHGEGQLDLLVARSASSSAPTATRRRRCSPPAVRSSARCWRSSSPRLLTTEGEFLEKNEFKVEYIPFDWSLNDLTGR